MGRTRASPRSGSTATSTNTAPKACMEKRWPASPGFTSADASIGRPRRRMASVMSLAPARASASSRALRQAACTALPTLAIVMEPPCTGALGSLVSPSMNFTRSIGRPRVSAATCVIRARLGVAPAPAEALRGDPVAFPSRAGGERQFLEFVLLRLVAQPQLDRIDVQGPRELVHRRFERVDAAHLAR